MESAAEELKSPAGRAKLVDRITRALIRKFISETTSRCDKAQRNHDDIRDTKVNPPDWGEASMDVVYEIIRQGELHIAAQLTSSLAADQRTSSMLSMIVTAATATLGGGLALLYSQQPNYILGFGGLSSGICLMVASWFLLEAIKPVQFYFAGNWPRNWFNEDEIIKDIKTSLGEMAVHYDEMIEFNDKILRRNGKFVKYAARTFFAAPLVGVLAIMISWLAIIS